MKKKRYEEEGAKEYREANQRIQKVAKKAKEDWIGNHIGVGRFRILGGPRFRILGGPRGGQIPSRHMTS